MIRIEEPRVHDGACDASAAVFMDTKGTQFLVADDEDQQHTKLRVYDAAKSGPPAAEHLLDHAFVKPDPDEPEIDIEGSAWSGGRIYWIGSHSRSKKGKPRPSRHRLFATELKKGVPQGVGSPYCTLVKDVARDLGYDIDPRAPPKDGGLSIEGLSASDREGELLIGLRSPLVKGCALIIPLRNAAEVVEGKKAKFGKPLVLDLDGLGIRSFDYWPERRSYLVLAGPPGDSGKDFHLLRWSGPLASRPELLDGVRFDEFGVDNGASPEALLIEHTSSTVYVLFDEGSRNIDGRKCKDAERKSFRSIAITGL